MKLRYLDDWNEARRRVAQRYNELLALWNTDYSAGLALSSNYSTGLADLPVTTPYESPDAHHVYHQYTIRASQRDALAAYLKKRGIGTMIYYPVPLHLQGLYASLGYGEGSPSTSSGRRLPVSEAASREVLSLPMCPEMTEAQQHEIAQAMREFYSG